MHPGTTEFVGAVTDVTISKEAEQRLRRGEAYLAEAERLSPYEQLGLGRASSGVRLPIGLNSTACSDSIRI